MPKQRRKQRNHADVVKEALLAVMREHRDEDLTRQDVTLMVEERGGLCAEWIRAIRESAVDREIGRILRSSEFVTDSGDVVRLFQCYKVFIQTEDGREVQHVFWRDIHTMRRTNMLKAARDRIAHGKRTIAKAQSDVNYWNANVAPLFNEDPIEPEQL